MIRNHVYLCVTSEGLKLMFAFESDVRDYILFPPVIRDQRNTHFGSASLLFM